jgi:hypothetical protein
MSAERDGVHRASGAKFKSSSLRKTGCLPGSEGVPGKSVSLTVTSFVTTTYGLRLPLATRHALWKAALGLGFVVMCCYR